MHALPKRPRMVMTVSCFPGLYHHLPKVFRDTLFEGCECNGMTKVKTLPRTISADLISAVVGIYGVVGSS